MSVVLVVPVPSLTTVLPSLRFRPAAEGGR